MAPLAVHLCNNWLEEAWSSTGTFDSFWPPTLKKKNKYNAVLKFLYPYSVYSVSVIKDLEVFSFINVYSFVYLWNGISIIMYKGMQAHLWFDVNFVVHFLEYYRAS